MKYLKMFENKSFLEKHGFVEIKEVDIPDYTGVDDDDLSSYEKEEDIQGIFGWLGHSDFFIMDSCDYDDILRYKDGSSEFIIKIGNILYLGHWNECIYDLDKKNDIDWAKNSKVFDKFKEGMKLLNVTTFITVNF